MIDKENIFLDSKIMKNLSYVKRLWLCFSTFFQIALFVVGGGLAMLPVIEEKFVRKTKILSQHDMLDMIVLTQTVPGLIAVNSAVFVGTKVAGFLGALLSVIAVILPSIVIILIIAIFFNTLNSDNPILIYAFKGVRSCITGIFFVTAYRLAKQVLLSSLIGVIVFVLFVLLVTGINPVVVLISSLPIGYIYHYLAKKSKVPFLVETVKK